MNYNDLEKILIHINDDIYNNYNEGDIQLQLSSDGYNEIFEFLGVVIWDSENDGRDFNEELNEYEDLETYVRRGIKQTIDKISKLKGVL